MEGMLILYLAIIVLLIASIWKVFTKAGQPGWAAIVPIYNFVVMLQVAKKPVWWILLFLIPVVNIVIMIIMFHAISQKFGNGVGFTLGLIFLPFIFFPILAFGDYKYKG
jgi:hypothetical protein